MPRQDIVQEKIEFQGVIRSIQPRTTVWRYVLDNRTHRREQTVVSDETAACEESTTG